MTNEKPWEQLDRLKHQIEGCLKEFRHMDGAEASLKESLDDIDYIKEMTGYYTGKVTSIEQVLADKPTTIWYGATTCWWTHKEEHLNRHPEAGLPCDPRGGVLFQTNQAEEFLKAAEANAEHYGKHGIKAFLAAHNDNMAVSETIPQPTCFRTWDEYNAILDAQGE